MLLCVLILGVGGFYVANKYIPLPLLPPQVVETEPTPVTPEDVITLDRSKVRTISREYLAREGGFLVNVPPADYVVIPILVGEYEHLAGWGWTTDWDWGIEDGTEDYLDSWLTDSRGKKINGSPRTFNYATGYGSPGLVPGTYYIYLSNEFDSVNPKKVILEVRWN